MISSLKQRMVVAIVLIALFPAIPLAWIFSDLNRNLLDLTLDPRVETAFEDAIDVVRTLITREKTATLKTTRQLAEDRDFLSLVRKISLGQATQSDLRALRELIAGRKLDRLAVFGSNARNVFDHENVRGTSFSPVDSAFVVDRLRTGSETAVYSEASGLIVASAPLLLPNQERGVIVAVLAVNPEFVSKTGDLVSALQTYQALGSDRPQLQTSFFLAFVSIYSALSVLSILLGIFFSSVMIRPIQKLVTGTEQIAAGNWDYKIIPEGASEFRHLAESFNVMVSRIKEENEKALHLEKMAAWREIAQRLAHEIKNPLTPIQLMAQQIKDSYRGDDTAYRKKLSDCCEIIDEEIDNLRNLTKEFSEFARLPVLKPRPADLNQLVMDVAALYSEKRLKVTLDQKLSSIEIDPEAVRRVLINLVDNAVTAIEDKSDGQIHVQTSTANGKARLMITDNGVGIPRDNLGKIFEPHFSTKKASMGLGLAIVKGILDEHRAMIEVESVENLGTSFTLEFHTTIPRLIEL